MEKVFFGKLEILKFENFSLVIRANIHNRIKKISKFNKNMLYSSDFVKDIHKF
jgi:hypothetical protein